MTVVNLKLTGAPKSPTEAWQSINWKQASIQVKRLQTRIAKAFREKKHAKVKALQWILTHSFYAKALAVKRVTTNQGAKTPGIDRVTWSTPKQKMVAALSLRRKGYKAQPLRRIYIPKKQRGKYRPLSIPVMYCRAQQALYLLALEPVSEMMADKNAYGFRQMRSTADALGQCFLSLCRKTSGSFILEGDIRSCFDMISSDWLLKNIPMDKRMLKQWLQAGYVSKDTFYLTERGVPQGGPISPTILNVTLSGLESAVKAVTKKSDRVNVIVYADDFVVTGRTKEILEEKVQPVIEAFLQERGLELSKDKTQITSIEEGFDFLGVNTRKYHNGKLIQKPTKEAVKRFIRELKETIKRNQAAPTAILIRLLNQKIIGWANYYRHYCSKSTFEYVSYRLFPLLWRWAIKRHRRKGARWVAKKYFRNFGNRRWQFSTQIINKSLQKEYLDLVEISHVPIRRHVKIKSDARPYDPAYHHYFRMRQGRRKSGNLVYSSKKSWSPWWEMQINGQTPGH